MTQNVVNGRNATGGSAAIARHLVPHFDKQRGEQAEQSPPPVQRLSISANIFSTLLLRVAGRISFVLLGFYLGEHFASATVVAMVLEVFYISELLLSPVVGGLSDRLGRKPFLFLAPILGICAALCYLLIARVFPHPDGARLNSHLIFLLVLMLIGRLLEGATTAFNTPACLGYITDTTVGSQRLRTRVMTAFEIVTVGGLALAIPFGGFISTWLGTWGFVVVVSLHVINTLVVIFVIKEGRVRIQQAKRYKPVLESLKLLRDKYMFTFLPAWLSVNSLVGAWLTLIVIMLTYPIPAADHRHPHQLLYGGFAKSTATTLLGAFGLLFLIGMGLWMLVLPRLRRTTVMFIGLGGLLLCIVALTIINGLGENIVILSGSSKTVILFLSPLVVIGILLLSGFTPASLTQMAAISEMKIGQRGAVMGLYSVVLSIGQFLGASMGGVSIDIAGFYGLMVFSALLGLLSLASVIYMRVHGHDLI